MFSFQMFKEDVSEEMTAIIHKDVHDLNVCDLSEKSGYQSNGKFVRMDRDVFVYHHTQHAPCTNVKLSSISVLILLAMEYKKTHYYSLWPFYDSNKLVLKC